MLVPDILFLAIIVYLAYRFIFNFLLPIVRATHQVRQQFRNNFAEGSQAGGRPGDQAARPDAASAGTKAEQRSYKPPAEDYIDFEEIK